MGTTPVGKCQIRKMKVTLRTEVRKVDFAYGRFWVLEETLCGLRILKVHVHLYRALEWPTVLGFLDREKIGLGDFIVNIGQWNEEAVSTCQGTTQSTLASLSIFTIRNKEDGEGELLSYQARPPLDPCQCRVVMSSGPDILFCSLSFFFFWQDTKNISFVVYFFFLITLINMPFKKLWILVTWSFLCLENLYFTQINTVGFEEWGFSTSSL